MLITRRAVLSSASALLAARLCAAQDWGTVGNWEILAPTNLGPIIAYRNPTWVAGAFIVSGNNTDTGYTAVWSYDHVTNSWAKWSDVVTNPPIADPFLFEVGGQVVIIDETNMLAVAYIDSVAARSTVGYTWSTPQVAGGPTTPRFGMRFAVFGGVVYAFGGVDIATGACHNDMWAIDGAQLVAGPGPFPPRWVQVAADNTPGFPPARVGYSFSSFGSGMVLAGGVSIDGPNPGGLLPDVCFSPTTNSVCHYHQSVWAFLPGLKQPELGSITGAAWVHLAEAGAYGGPVMSGRFDHTAGAMGDQLFLFGGTTAAGPSNEMWVYNLVSQTWQQVTQTSPWPAANTDLGWGLGAVIGRHLYRYTQITDPNTGMPLPGSGQLWRWAPAPSAGNNPPAINLPTHPGIVATIVIGTLLTVVNTVILYGVAKHAGALPAWAEFGGCGGCCSGRVPSYIPGSGASTPAAAGAAGFYTSVHESPEEGKPAYAPPM